MKPLNMNSQNINSVGTLHGKSVSDLLSEHTANNAKVSADGSIDTHSDVLIAGTPADNQLLIYSTGQWRNVASPFLRLDGTTSMTGALNMGGFAISGATTCNGIDLTTLAVDGSVVKLTGEQTIGGNKKFTSTLEVSGSTNPASFDGIGIAFESKIGVILAQKTATATYYPIQITGSYVDLYAGDNVIATATGTTLSLNNRKITNLATPTATTDGANKSYVDTLDGQNVKLTGNQTIAGIKTYSSGLEITGNSTNATTKGTFVVFNSTANIGTIGCLDMGTGVNYNFEINAKKVSFIIDGAIVGWVNASGLDCNSSKIANLGTPTLATDGATKGYADTLDGQNVKLTGDQTITGIKIFNGTRNDIRGLTLSRN